MTKLRRTIYPNFHKHRKARCKILKPVKSLSVGSKSVINKVMTILSSGGKNNNDVGHNLQIEFGLFGVRVSPVSFYKASTKSLEIRGYLKRIRNEVFANLFTTSVAQSMKWRKRAVIKFLCNLLSNEVKKQEINQSQSCAPGSSRDLSPVNLSL